MKLSQMQEDVRRWAIEKGWRGPDAPPRSFGDDMALLHTEISEAVEAYRVWGMDRMVRMKQDPKVVMRQDNLDVTGLDWSSVSPDDGGWTADTKPEGVPSEFADLLIRLLDDCAEYGIDLESEYHKKMAYNHTRAFRHGGKRL